MILSGLLTYAKTFDLLIFYNKRMNVNYPFCSVLKELMAEKGLSQAAFGATIGVNQTTVGQWLLGKKKPSYDNILAICKTFGITPNELFGM